MAIERQKNAARHNLMRARAVQAARRRGFHVPRLTEVEAAAAAERDKAWRRIKAAAQRVDVSVPQRRWRQLFGKGHLGRGRRASHSA